MSAPDDSLKWHCWHPTFLPYPGNFVIVKHFLQKYQPFEFFVLVAGSYARVLELGLQKRWVFIVTIPMIVHAQLHWRGHADLV